LKAYTLIEGTEPFSVRGANQILKNLDPPLLFGLPFESAYELHFHTSTKERRYSVCF
jgi:hypothetical protein